MSNEIEVWYSEYELRQFIDMAVRYKIEGVFKSRTKSEPFSVFSFYVENARKNFDLFANQLNTKLTQNDKWEAIKIDVKYRFLPMLNQYLNWYEENKTELEKFQPLCPYSIMLSVIESTKAEILKYFPEPLSIQESKQELKKDTRFYLTSFVTGIEQGKHEYKALQSEIERNGLFKVTTKNGTVKVYTPELAVIIISKELPVRNMDTQTETTINGWDYLDSYVDGYKEGEQYFESEFKVSPNIIYGENASQYVRGIHDNYFHSKHTGINEGWSEVKKSYPIVLTHESIKRYGYYSGIVSKVEEQIKKHSPLFATFDKCEHNLPPQPIVESPFSVLEWATIFYYADETKLLTESRLIKTRLEQFMSKHQINTTFDNFKTKYYEAKKRINEKNDYPINKLELIIPFLKENYKQTVTKVENDIIFLEENKPEY